MEDKLRGAGPAEELTPEERAFFARRLLPPEAPSLPASLTAEALFRRLDEGTLALPEETAASPAPAQAPAEPAPAEKSAGVIPWQRALRRWLPAAACLVLVLLLYRNRQPAPMARNLTSQAVPSSQAAVSAAEDAPAESGSPENAPAAAAAPPAPEPAQAPAPQSGGLRSDRNGGAESRKDAADSAGPESAAPAEEEYLNSGAGGPPTGGTDANPDTGPNNPPGTPDTGGGDPDTGGGEPDIPPRTLAVYEAMKSLARANAPAGCTYAISSYDWLTEEGQLTFQVLYLDEDDEDAGSLLFTCQVREEEKDGRPLWLEVLSCESLD